MYKLKYSIHLLNIEFTTSTDTDKIQQKSHQCESKIYGYLECYK